MDKKEIYQRVGEIQCLIHDSMELSYFDTEAMNMLSERSKKALTSAMDYMLSEALTIADTIQEAIQGEE